MGVIINAPDPFVDYIEDALDNLLEAELEAQARTVRKQRKQKTRSPAKPSDCMNSSKINGSRRKRRFENTAFLMTLTDNHDFEEVDIYDFIPQHVSAFAQIIMGKESFQAFNKFINCSEEEQNQFFEDDLANENHSPQNDENDIEDQRSVHPAFTADNCFSKVASKFRNAMTKRHFPLGNLAYLENEIISFFTKWPQSVYVSKFPNSYDRLLVHALCQYLDLCSKSFDQRGVRHTKVKNLRNEFIPPDMTLSAYLEKQFPVH